MAKQTVIIDDIDGSSDATTVTFALQGKTYEIDLGAKNLEKLEKALEPYTTAGRRTGGASRVAASARRTNLTDIRTWADQQGLKVSPRGRVSAEVLQAYDAAH